MINMKKTAIAAAMGLAMISGAAQAAHTDFSFTGSFLMYDGTDPDNFNMFQSYAYVGPLGDGSFSEGGIMDNGNGTAGDPIAGNMRIDMSTGAGTASMTGQPFFGSTWTASNIVFTGVGPGLEHVSMLFNWGDPDTNTSCGLTNCNIVVDAEFQMYPISATQYGFYTTASWMLGGPFAGAQPTFSGVATVVPVPAAAWLLGSGLLGLVGVARRKVAVA